MKKLSILLACAALVATASFSQAQPITLENGITVVKFNNLENLIIPTANIGLANIAVGDQFAGVLLISNIGTTSDPNQLSGQLGTTDLYGTFLFNVTSTTGALPINGTPGTGTLTLALTPGDYLNLYTAPHGTYNSAVTAGGSVISNLQGAAGSTLWASVTGTDYVQGVSNSAGTGSVENYNWANFTVNNTGYDIIKVPYGPYDGFTNTVQFYFQDNVIANIPGTSGVPSSEFAFTSTDPGYITTVPEPATFALVGFGLLGVGFFARRRNQK